MITIFTTDRAVKVQVTWGERREECDGVLLPIAATTRLDIGRSEVFTGQRADAEVGALRPSYASTRNHPRPVSTRVIQDIGWPG